MLELRNISKRFGDKQILSDFNLTIHEGKILAIVGPSGGGKTTLLRMLAGLEKIDSGEVFYNGEYLALDELTKRQLLGFVFQDFQLFPHLSVLENLTISPVKMNGMPQEEANGKARALLERLGLAEFEDAFPYSLSGGQSSSHVPRRPVVFVRLRVNMGMTQIVVTHDLTPSSVDSR